VAVRSYLPTGNKTYAEVERFLEQSASTHHHRDRQHPAGSEGTNHRKETGISDRHHPRDPEEGIRTWEIRRDGVGEVGVPHVAVALPQLHLLHQRLRPRHLATLGGALARPRTFAYVVLI
jgi:hypothetical protein